MIENSLREVRISSGVSQVALAKEIGVSRQTIHAIETGKYVPSVELCLKLGEFFNLHIEEIFKLKRQ